MLLLRDFFTAPLAAGASSAESVVTFSLFVKSDDGMCAIDLRERGRGILPLGLSKLAIM